MESLANNPTPHGQFQEEEQEEERHFSYAAQLVTSGTLPMVLTAALRLHLFDIIAGAGPGAQLSPSEIAAQLSPPDQRNDDINVNNINPNAAAMLDRMLRLLASHSVLTCASGGGCGDGPSRQRLYGLAPAAKYFVRNEKGVSLGPLLQLLQDKVLVESWYQLDTAVVEGGLPFEMVHGTHAFDYLGKTPRFNEAFNKGMINHTTVVMNRILDKYKGFESLNTLVDVGGGLGVTLNAIIMKWPNIKGINFDLPHVIQHAPTYPGVEHVAGDMFESVPAGDAIFMKWILHDWDDDHCSKLLKNCYKALPESGKLIVVDGVLPMIPDTSSSVKTTCQSDLIMMAQTPGGKERTEQEFSALATAAGFSGIRLVCYVFNLWVMEFHK